MSAARTTTAKPTPLSRDRIIDTAIMLVRRQGLPGLSMRRIAASLNVAAMSLYHYVPNRHTLIVWMADRSLSQLPPSEPSHDWDVQLTDLMVATSAAARVNPAVFLVLAGDPNSPTDADCPDDGPRIRLRRQTLALLRAGFVPEAQHAAMLHALLSVVIGCAAPAHLSVPSDDHHAADPPAEAFHATTDAAQQVRFAVAMLLNGARTLHRNDIDSPGATTRL